MPNAIALEHQGRKATLLIQRPPLNILDLSTLRSLRSCLGELMVDPDLQLLILRGAGDRAFSAGVAVEDHTEDKVPDMLQEFHGAIAILRDMPAVTLAVVHGHCLGGGMELAAGCDLVVASRESRFGQPEIKLGCFPPLAAVGPHDQRRGGGRDGIGQPLRSGRGIGRCRRGACRVDSR